MSKTLRNGWIIFVGSSLYDIGKLQVNIRVRPRNSLELSTDDRTKKDNFGSAAIRIFVSEY